MTKPLKPVLLILVVWAVILPVSAQTAFQHPGVLVSKAQLDFVKAQVNAKAEPFYTEYQWAAASRWGDLKYKMEGPPAAGFIQCGSHSNPNYGCKEVDNDTSAAYVQALLWYITGNRAYARNAIAIMNTYARTLKGYAGWTAGVPCPAKPAECSNGPLQAAWDSEKWPRAAEIIRYSNAGWADSDARAFADMLKRIYVPLIYDGSGANGNWELSMIDGMMGIAVFTEDAKLMQHAETFWRERVPAYYYYAPIDGRKPAPFPRNTGHTNWNGQTVFDARVNGIAQETCRDFHHTEYGIAATMNAAETAHIQGVKLFESEQQRLIAALEFSAGYELARSRTSPAYVCGGKIDLGPAITYVIGYNEYHNRLGQAMPNTAALIKNWVLTKPSPVDAANGPHMAIFEPLTHYEDASSVILDGRSLARSYTDSETLTYRMRGLNENWSYQIDAKGIVKKDSAGTYVEEYHWSNFVSDGRKTELSSLGAGFTQVLSLDPKWMPSVPDLSKTDLRIIGPITDLLTFYSDLWLAIKLGNLTHAGDHYYFKRGTPASWADGNHVLVGEDSFDFDLTLTAVDLSNQTATLLVRHVVPEKPQVKLIADWMQRPVTDKPNNWVQVQKLNNGKYVAAVGKERFDVEIKLSLVDGKIVSATIDNPVVAIERECADMALTTCEAAKPHSIRRRIELSLIQ